MNTPPDDEYIRTKEEYYMPNIFCETYFFCENMYCLRKYVLF